SGAQGSELVDAPLRDAEAFERLHQLPHRRPIGVAGRCRPHAGSRLLGTFRDMRVAVDDLEVGQAEEAEKLGPWPLAMIAPDLEERHAMIDLGGTQEPLARLGAAMPLQTLQQA